MSLGKGVLLAAMQRDSYGVPLSEPRHPDIASGKSWPILGSSSEAFSVQQLATLFDGQSECLQSAVTPHHFLRVHCANPTRNIPLTSTLATLAAVWLPSQAKRRHHQLHDQSVIPFSTYDQITNLEPIGSNTLTALRMDSASSGDILEFHRDARHGKISRKNLHTSVILFTVNKDIHQVYKWPRNGQKVNITHKAIRSR